MRSPGGIAGRANLPLMLLQAREVLLQHFRPIFQAHGTRDGVIPIARAAQSRDALASLGYQVEWHEYPMEHSVCMEEIADLNRYLLKGLA